MVKAVERLWRRALEPGIHRRLVVAGLAVGAIALWRGIDLADDSTGYLASSAYRPPLYPLLLAALDLVFGRHALAALLLFQVALGITAATALVLYLRRALALPEWQTWLAMALLLALPYLGPQVVANRVLSEGLAYPLFLLVMRSLLGAMLESRLDRFAAAAGWAAALLLCRLQFVYVLPVLAVCALMWLVESRSRRRALAALGLLAVVTAGTLAADRGYRLVRHGRFAGAPFTGLQLLAGALYVSPRSLVDELPAAQRDLFTALHDAARRRGLLADANPSPGGISSYAWHFRQNYNPLVWGLIMPELRQRSDWQTGGEDWFAVERQLLPLALALIRAEPLGFARLYLSNLLSSLSFPYAILLAVAAPLALYRGFRRGDRAHLALAVVLLTHLANCALVALVEPLKLRYSFYTDGLVVVLLIALLFSVARPADPDVRHRG